ncbi:hypothetical protein [Hydrogenispora ethanolica]|uniref:hypothetical protein n=1 Tax=Hydrogenispora ethanolica TaxID=1082276 RepID=UPI001404F46F|nr:hypothetical protein [Hydrogenispora ethanolica]
MAMTAMVHSVTEEPMATIAVVPFAVQVTMATTAVVHSTIEEPTAVLPPFVLRFR